MAYIFGKNYSRKDLMRKIGNIEQIAGIRSFEYCDGKSAHTKAIEINTGALSVTLLPSRCLDIASACYKGYPFGYLSKSGIRNPEYFTENNSKGFLDNFFGGLLTTSGLNNVGSPSSDKDTAYGLHGEISNIPAETIAVDQYWDDDELIFKVKGTMKHSRFYGEDLLFTREITTRLGSSKIHLRDTIENLDFKSTPIFLLYHINFGFPLVDENAYLSTNGTEHIFPRTESAAKGLTNASLFQPPEDQKEEECFYYYFKNNDVKVSITNPSLGSCGLRAYLKYHANQFPEFVEWKFMRSREYVCGFAPSTNKLEGRENALKNELVKYLEPLEKITFESEIGIEELE